MHIDDLKTLPAGSELLVRATIRKSGLDADGELQISCGGLGGEYNYCKPEDVVAVAVPLPRLFEEGDRVIRTSLSAPATGGEIIAISDGAGRFCVQWLGSGDGNDIGVVDADEIRLMTPHEINSAEGLLASRH